jgi:hypothetical protein
MLVSRARVHSWLASRCVLRSTAYALSHLLAYARAARLRHDTLVVATTWLQVTDGHRCVASHFLRACVLLTLWHDEVGLGAH